MHGPVHVRIYISWFINFLETMKIRDFHQQMVLRNLSTCVLDFCVMSVVWSLSVHSSICVMSVVWSLSVHSSIYGFQFEDWSKFYF